MVRRIGHSPAALLVGFGLSFVLAPPALAINGTVKVSEFVKGSIQIWFEAEAFDERCPPPETPQDVPDIHDFYPVVEAEGAFDDGELPAGADGLAISPVNDVGGRLTYVFNIARAKGAVGGTWYFWGRVVDPGNRSEYMLVREDPGDPVIPSGPCDSTVFPGGNKAGFAGSSFDNQDDRVFERNTGAEGPPPVWGWSGGNRGHVKELRDGQNEMFLFHRESRPPVLWDVFLWTNDPGYVPTDQDYLDAKEAPPLPECPAAGDTHCGSATVEGPPGGGVGTYRVTVNGAVDDSGDPIIYSVSADDGVNPATTVSQTGDNVIELFLPPGSWTLTVTVDDDVLCDDAAPDNTCAIAPFEILPPEDEGDFKVSQHGAGVQIWIQAEKFRGRFDAGGPDLDPPIEPHAVFPVVAAKGAFGDPAANAVNRTRANGMLRYDFDISAAGGLGGTWTIWGRIINPSNASDYVLVDGDPDDPEIPFAHPSRGGTRTSRSPTTTTASSRPTRGARDLLQSGAGRRRTTRKATQRSSGTVRTRCTSRRQGSGAVFWDVFMLTDDPDYRPTDQDFLLAESMNHPECTDDADTHCRSFTVDGPPGNTAGIYTVTVDATDDDGTPFIYTLIADDGLNPLRRVIQPENNVLEIFLFPGFWTLSVVVDDDRLCDDEANDNTCIGEPFEVFPGDDPCAAEVPGAAEATLEAAFTFQHDAFSCPVFNDQGIDYLPVAQTDPLFIEYDPALGYGYERVYPDLNDLPYGERGGYGVFGPMDETPNDRDRFGDGCPDELYDSFIGGKDFDLGCAGVIDNTVPCDPPEGIIFRVDVPNGRYRFVAAVGDSENEHAHRILVEDGGEGPPDVIGPNSVVLVENFDQAEHGEGVFARVGFDGRIPPPGSGFPPPGVAFVNMDADGLATEACPSSPTLEVTEKYIRIHQLKGSSIGTDANGGDLVVLEIWSVEGGPEPTGFVRGDADSNGSINLTDGIVILNFLFLGGPAPPCLDAADTDDDGGQRPTLTDAVIVFQWLFSGGEPPRPPSPGVPDYAPGECGPDATDDEMDCATLAAKCTP